MILSLIIFSFTFQPSLLGVSIKIISFFSNSAVNVLSIPRVYFFGAKPEAHVNLRGLFQSLRCNRRLFLPGLRFQMPDANAAPVAFFVLGENGPGVFPTASLKYCPRDLFPMPQVVVSFQKLSANIDATAKPVRSILSDLKSDSLSDCQLVQVFLREVFEFHLLPCHAIKNRMTEAPALFEVVIPNEGADIKNQYRRKDRYEIKGFGVHFEAFSRRSE